MAEESAHGSQEAETTLSGTLQWPASSSWVPPPLDSWCFCLGDPCAEESGWSSSFTHWSPLR